MCVCVFFFLFASDFFFLFQYKNVKYCVIYITIHFWKIKKGEGQVQEGDEELKWPADGGGVGGLDISKGDVSELNLAGLFGNPPIGGGSNSGGGDGSAGFKVGGLGGGSGGGGSLFGNPPATMETAGVLSGGQNTMPDNSGNFLAQGGFNDNFGQSNPSIPFGQSSPNSSGSIFGPSSSDNSMNNNPNISGLTYPQINAQPNQSQSQPSMFGNQTGQQISFGQANQSQSQPSILVCFHPFFRRVSYTLHAQCRSMRWRTQRKHFQDPSNTQTLIKNPK